MFWGLTPALNLLEELQKYTTLPDEINILIIGGTDCRHILQTLARRYRYKKVKLHFYLMEACSETIAKQLLYLYIGLQQEAELGLVQKTRYFMELYGNTLVRPAVANYLTSVSKGLVDMITNFDFMKEIMPFLNVQLRYKERDYIENLFKFWCATDHFEITENWDLRLRRSLGVRYDTKNGAFDWDLHMRYHNVGGAQVANQEYQSFRSNGVAFSWLESEVSKPNRSMVCAIVPSGTKFLHYGYMGDMVTGPYVAFGLDSEDKDFLKKTNNVYNNRATDVTERNLRQIFYEIQNNEEYVHQKTNDINLGCVVTQFNNISVVEKCDECRVLKKQIKKCLDVEDVNITILSLTTLSTFKYKGQFNKFFDLVYFNSNYLKHFDSETVGKIAKMKSLLIVENSIFVLSNREKQLDEYKEQLIDKLENINRKDIPFNVQKDYYAKFVLNS